MAVDYKLMGYYAKIIIKVKLGHNKKVFYNRGFY